MQLQALSAIIPARHIILLLFLSIAGCKKGPGEGGSSSIRGKIFRYGYNANFSTLLDSSFAEEEDVYIIYGDAVTFGDRQNTNHDGSYEFKYLRKGKYTIFAYEDDSTKYPVKARRAVEIVVEITENKQNLDAPQLNLVKDL